MSPNKPLTSVGQLEWFRNRILAESGKKRTEVHVCMTGCRAYGAAAVRDALVEAVSRRGLDDQVEIRSTGCHGFCAKAPVVAIEPLGVQYQEVDPEDALEIVDRTLKNNQLIDRLAYRDPKTGQFIYYRNQIPFYKKQVRRVLANCGRIDPTQIEQYIGAGGYKALVRALTRMTPDQVVEEVVASKLRGRGGAGFPTGIKWRFARQSPTTPKYVVCNADEGDPGAFMDRAMLEGDPHAVIEGMMIGGYAMGAEYGIIYVREEYPIAVEHLTLALEQGNAIGLLGENILGTGFNFHLSIKMGAGAFVCGEETALMASIEGLRGMPRPKPPFPAQSGLWGKPTVINNVETLGSVPMIILHGSHSYRTLGTPNSPGTKTFALTGHVVNTGLIEVPFGTTLREIIFDIGGGVIDKTGEIDPDGFKAVQIGGPSGGCLVEEHLDLPLDFDSVKKTGAIIGSGGLVVMNRDTCMVQIAHFFMRFTQNESCGKCVPCREGTKQMLALLHEIIEGRGTSRTLELLEQLAPAVQIGSLCGLGKTAPNPVLSTLRYFRSEYEAHIFQKRCPAGQCKALAVPEILIEKCKGCGACLRKCPVGAITGEKKAPHRIDAKVCIKCGTCAQACKFNAIVGV